MATINFLYRSTKDTANLNLRLLYRLNGIDLIFGAKTKLEISKQYWTKQHDKKSKDIDVINFIADTNNELNKIENHILKAFNSVKPTEVNKEWLQTQIDYYYNPPKQVQQLPTELLKYFLHYIESKKTSTANSTQKKYSSTLRLLERYQIDNGSIIQIADVNISFKNKFEKYCEENNYGKNTISKLCKTIKAVCNDAALNYIETSSQLKAFKAPTQAVEKIYLTFDDLAKIEAIDEGKLTESLNNAKDWLIISCYTGQRVSDFMRFTPEQIRTEDGNSFLEITQKKTDKITAIPLHPKVLELLEKRNGNFPYRISDQKYNDYIKQVCKLAELNQPTKGSKLLEIETGNKIYRKKKGVYPKWELVTSHIGRRSFATCFYGTIPTPYLINITNHATEAQFRCYLSKPSAELAKETFKYF
jgi:integrase